MSPVAPYGSWPSPITPALLVEQAVGLSFASVCGDRVWWVESRPSEQGRQVLMSGPLDGGSPPQEETPPGLSVRTQVHEYGGRCYVVRCSPGDASTVVFSNWADQRLWAMSAGAEARPLTPEPDHPRGARYADPAMDPSGRWVICVREHHGADGVVNDLVAVPVGPGEGTPQVLASGHDFFAAPRLSPDASRLAWITWDHPSMPWDSTQLWAAGVSWSPEGLRLERTEPVAGGPDESVTQPRWSPQGVLHYVSDRSGWWNIYDETGRAVAPAEAEFADPDWVFGNSNYGFDPRGNLLASWSGPEGRRLGRLGPPGEDAGEDFEAIDLPFSSYSSLCPIDGGAIAIAASATLAPALVRIDWDRSHYEVLKRSREVPVPIGTLSSPQRIEFPTGDGEAAHALFYPPANQDWSGPPGERPPLMVVIHGGPTSQASAVLNLGLQFWTSRGFAVADVDYRGSSGYGRAYRKKLDAAWGIADVEDCAAVVAELDRRGMVDGRRAVIRGGSAGGFTTLAALAFTDGFAAGASHYGVADLELLARDTHKFEARYLDSIVGPWPASAEEYRRRSPIHHVDRITNPLILFQGLEDMVVPPEQSQLMYDALASRGVPVAYLTFEGEQHGFRRAETVMRVCAAELQFYGRVLGFSPDLDGDTPLDIANPEALTHRP